MKTCYNSLWFKIFVNIIIFIVLFFIIDFVVYKIAHEKYVKQCASIKENFPDWKPNPFPYSLKFYTFQERYNSKKNEEDIYTYRPVEGSSYNKNSILIFGCSYAMGHLLKDDEILSYKLSKIMKRPVYNRALSGFGIQHTLYQLRQESFENEIAAKPDFVIHVFFDGHVERLYTQVFDLHYDRTYLQYRDKGGVLEEVNPKCMWLRRFYITKKIQKIILRNQIKYDNSDAIFDFMNLHFIESKKMIDEKYPGAKFVVLKYINWKDNWIDKSPRWKELEDEGIIVIDTKELTGEDFYLSEYKVSDGHPNAKAWEVLAPKLAEFLNSL